MGSYNVRFPVNLSYGSAGGPSFNTQVIETDSGKTFRVARWSKPRYEYDASYSIRSIDDLAQVMQFYNSVLGPANTFRFKDWQDYSSAGDGHSAPTYSDQLIATGDGVQADFQLIKEYTAQNADGAIVVTNRRLITKPVRGTFLVSVDDIQVTSGWNINETTGILTFDAGSIPSAGEPIKAGFEFDVHVRFAKELDHIAVSIESFETGSVGRIPLVEAVDEEPFSDHFYYGGAELIEPESDFTITENNGRLIVVNSLAGDSLCRLPDIANMPKGYPHWVIWNNTVYTLTIQTVTGAEVGVLASSDTGLIAVGVDSDDEKVWYLFTP
jgi:uncharacterized protein (TIGR02217 family)